MSNWREWYGGAFVSGMLAVVFYFEPATAGWIACAAASITSLVIAAVEGSGVLS